MNIAQRLRALAKRTALDSIGEELVAIAQELESSKALSWLAACRTLERLGYTYHGAELWKPPLGNPAAQPGAQHEATTQAQDDSSSDAQVDQGRLRDADSRVGAQVPALTQPAPVVPEWIVNDLGELGVKVGGRFFFLYKGDNIEYGKRGDSVSDSGVALHDDCTPMRYRTVGKVEFGETCWPVHWVRRGYGDDRYTLELVYEPGLSDGTPQDAEWRFLPAASQAKGGGA